MDHRALLPRLPMCLAVLTAVLRAPIAACEPRLLRVHGEVRETESGEPVSSARLFLGRTDRPGLAPRIAGEEVLSADSGRFELRVEVQKDGPLLHLCARREGRADWTTAIRVSPDAQSVRIDVGMDPERLVEGRVVDLAGDPVADAELVVFRIPTASPGPIEDPDVEPEHHVARTEADGKFRLKGLGSGEYAYRVCSGGRGGAGGGWSTDQDPVEITLDPPRTAKLVCRGGSEGEAAKNIRVVLWSEEQWWCAEQTGRTDECLEFADLPEKYLEARAESEDGTLWLGACGSVTRETILTPSTRPRALTLTCEVRAAGSRRPIRGAVVWSEGRCARADAQGLVRFRGLTPGPMELYVHDETSERCFASEPVRIEIGRQPAETRIAIDVKDRVSLIEGSVVGADGEPVACAEVWLRRYDEPPWDRSEREAATTVPVESDGTFGVALPDVDCWVRFVAHHPLHGWARSDALHVASGRPGEMSRLELRFEGCVRLTGRLLEASGAPAAGATIETRPLDMKWGMSRWLAGVEGLIRSSRCDSEGRFQLHGIPSGPTSIHAVLPDGARRTIGFLWADPASSPAVLELRMPKPRVLCGRIRDAQGRPLSIGLDAATKVRPDTNRPDSERTYRQSTRSGTDGTFRFEDIPGPVGTLRIRCPDRGHEFPPVRVESGDVELVLPD